MALKVKDSAASRDKFIARGSSAAGDYASGVKGAGPAWAQGASAGADNYAAGVQDAITRGAFARGVQQAGPAKYEGRASTVGAQRFPQGIRDAGPAWEAGTKPYLDTLSSLTLPPRRPKGDPGNFLRAQVVGEALRRRRTGG
jgi:hypothetical protein